LCLCVRTRSRVRARACVCIIVVCRSVGVNKGTHRSFHYLRFKDKFAIVRYVCAYM